MTTPQDERSINEGKTSLPQTDGAGTVDNRDTLKPGQWDRSGAGEIDSGSPSSVGADSGEQDGSNKTSAGT